MGSSGSGRGDGARGCAQVDFSRCEGRAVHRPLVRGDEGCRKRCGRPGISAARPRSRARAKRASAAASAARPSAGEPRLLDSPRARPQSRSRRPRRGTRRGQRGLNARAAASSVASTAAASWRRRRNTSAASSTTWMPNSSAGDALLRVTMRGRRGLRRGTTAAAMTPAEAVSAVARIERRRSSASMLPRDGAPLNPVRLASHARARRS